MRRFPLVDLQHLAARAPLFEVLFNFVHFRVYDTLTTLPDFHILARHELAQTSLPLVVHCELTSTLALTLECGEEGFSDEQLQAILHAYLHTLDAIAAHPEQPYHLFSPLTSLERTRLLENRGPDEEEEAHTGDLAELVERQVSYQALDAHASRLADRLHEACVGPETRIGLCLPRTPELLVALLAILKAGGAYVPLDPLVPPGPPGLPAARRPGLPAHHLAHAAARSTGHCHPLAMPRGTPTRLCAPPLQPAAARPARDAGVPYLHLWLDQLIQRGGHYTRERGCISALGRRCLCPRRTESDASLDLALL